jgi:hypothetical protein
VVAWSGEFPEVPNSRVNPDRRLLGTRVVDFQVFGNSAIWRIVGEIYFGVKSLEALKYQS